MKCYVSIHPTFWSTLFHSYCVLPQQTRTRLQNKHVWIHLRVSLFITLEIRIFYAPFLSAVFHVTYCKVGLGDLDNWFCGILLFAVVLASGGLGGGGGSSGRGRLFGWYGRKGKFCSSVFSKLISVVSDETCYGKIYLPIPFYLSTPWCASYLNWT